MRATAVTALVTGAFGVAVACAPRVAVAQGPMRLVVWAAEGDRPILDRIRGQLSDLDVEMTTVAAAKDGAPLRSQIETAEHLARDHDASVVLWFDASASSDWLIVYIFTPGSGRVLVRTLGSRAKTDAGPTSATLEAGAIVVHAGIEALAAGATIGFTKEQVLAEPEARAPAPPPAATNSIAPERPPPTSLPRGAASRWTLTGAVGWQVDTLATSLTDQGPLAGVRLGFDGWKLGLEVSTTLGATLPDPRARIRIRRPAGFVRIARAWSIADQSELEASACAGFLAFLRDTSEPAPGVTASASETHFTPFLGPELGMSLAPSPLPLRVRVTFGLDVALAPLVIGYAAGGTFQQDAGIWAVEPRLGLELDWVSHL